MKLLLISDTHSRLINNTIYNHVKPDIACHLGDSELLESHIDLSNYDHLVRGNCDLNNTLKTKKINVDNINIMLTHGHLYGVNFNLDEISNLALKNNCNIAIHGHTHVVCAKYHNDVLIINPGSASESRSSYPETYMVLEIDNKIKITLYDVKTHEKLEIK